MLSLELFDGGNETNIYEIKWRKLRSHILSYFISAALFKKISQFFIEKSNTLEKNVIVHINDIRNLEDPRRLLLINGEYGYLLVVNDEGEGGRSQTFYNSLYMFTQ